MVYSWSLYVKEKRELSCNCSLILTAPRSLVLWYKEYGNKGINSLYLRTSVLRKTTQNLRPPDTKEVAFGENQRSTCEAEVKF